MDGALETLRREFAGLRTGRASPACSSRCKVEAYGTEMPLTQVGTIGVPEPRMLTVRSGTQSWSARWRRRSATAGLGLNPAVDGQIVRVPIPQLTAERRNELAKLAGRYAEGARIAVRGVRRDGMEQIKALREEARDQRGRGQGLGDEVQKLTDQLHQAGRRSARREGKNRRSELGSRSEQRRCRDGAAGCAMPAAASTSRRASVPRHVAIIMDGNGRWAKARGLPRIAGHRAGAQAVRRDDRGGDRARRRAG